eukprot:6240548-Prorocentrum_lima.AAC.1
MKLGDRQEEEHQQRASIIDQVLLGRPCKGEEDTAKYWALQQGSETQETQGERQSLKRETKDQDT